MWKDCEDEDRDIILKSINLWTSKLSSAELPGHDFYIKVTYPELIRNDIKAIGVAAVPTTASQREIDVVDENMLLVRVFRRKGLTSMAIPREEFALGNEFVREVSDQHLFVEDVEKIKTLNAWLEAIGRSIDPKDHIDYRYKCNIDPIKFIRGCNQAASKEENIVTRHALMKVLLYVLWKVIYLKREHELFSDVEELVSSCFELDVKCGIDESLCDWMPEKTRSAIREKLLNDYECFMVIVEESLRNLKEPAIKSTFIHFASLLYAYNEYHTLGDKYVDFAGKIVDILT